MPKGERGERMNITLPGKVKDDLESLVACGYYGGSASAVAVHLIQRQLTTQDIQKLLDDARSERPRNVED